jgi:uncharacterized membrane protein
LNIQKESNQDILDRANEVQTDIMMRTKILDKSFTITTMANLSDYVSEINDRFEIRDIINMTTKRSLHYIALANVSKVMNTQGTSPVYVTVYDKEVSFIPTPTASENITFLTYQKSVQEPMGIDVEPELPVSCDNAIIHGTMAKYDPKMFELYQVDINLLLETKTKYSGQYQHRNTIKSSW